MVFKLFDENAKGTEVYANHLENSLNEMLVNE